MKSFFTRKLIVAASAIMLVGAGAGVAVATQISGGTSRQAYLNDVAKRLGVSPSQLTTALKGAALDRINAAVAAGALTKAQAQKLEQRLQQGGNIPFFGPGAPGFAFGRRFGGPGRMMGAHVVTTYLGISAAALRSDIQSGKSLAQIASSTPGKSAAGLKAALTTALKTRLDAAVAHHRITAAQEQKVLGKLSTRLDTILNRSFRGALMPGMRPHLRFGWHP